MKLTDATGRARPTTNRCPKCNGEAVEVTVNGDGARRFVCNRDCAHRWSVAFAKSGERSGS